MEIFNLQICKFSIREWCSYTTENRTNGSFMDFDKRYILTYYYFLFHSPILHRESLNVLIIFSYGNCDKCIINIVVCINCCTGSKPCNCSDSLQSTHCIPDNVHHHHHPFYYFHPFYHCKQGSVLRLCSKLCAKIVCK